MRIHHHDALVICNTHPDALEMLRERIYGLRHQKKQWQQPPHQEIEVVSIIERRVEANSRTLLHEPKKSSHSRRTDSCKSNPQGEKVKKQIFGQLAHVIGAINKQLGLGECEPTSYEKLL